MTGVVLVWSGVFLALWGTWRGYTAAREALLPLARQGDPTRSLVDAARPVHERARVRLVARHVAVAVLALAVALYGLYLATVGIGAPA